MLNPLTDKEYAVLQLLAQGFCGKEIADKLGICVPAVTSRKNRLFKKLQARTAAHAVHIADREGWLGEELR